MPGRVWTTAKACVSYLLGYVAQKRIGEAGILKYALAALVAALAISGRAQSQEITLKLSAFIPDQAPTFAQVIKPWADAINAEGEGILKIDTFPGGALGGNPGLQAKMVTDGVADIALVIPAYSPGRFPDDEVMELPSMVKTSTESSVALWRLYDRGLLRGYDDFRVIMLSTTNPYAIHTKEPVRTMADTALDSPPRSRSRSSRPCACPGRRRDPGPRLEGAPAPRRCCVPRARGSRAHGQAARRRPTPGHLRAAGRYPGVRAHVTRAAATYRRAGRRLTP